MRLRIRSACKRNRGLILPAVTPRSTFSVESSIVIWKFILSLAYCRAGNGTNAAVANNEDRIRLLCLCRVRGLKHRESVRGKEQQPKHECYNGWTDCFHTVTVPCAGI